MTKDLNGAGRTSFSQIVAYCVHRLFSKRRKIVLIVWAQCSV
jgi:hypothetical protein